MIIWKPNYKPYPTLLPRTPIEIGGAVITPTQVLILAMTAVSLAVLMYVVNYTKLGRAMRATAENPRVAALMGVKPDMVISATFLIGAILAAIAGVIQLRHGTAHHGLFAGPESLYRRRVWRHRQPGGRRRWWHPAGLD
jgi:branched-chain amino acid transport system permease protein